MACSYKCPYSYRSNNYKFLTCKLLLKDLDNKELALSAVCAFQHMCPTTNRIENIADKAKECYEYHSKKS